MKVYNFLQNGTSVLGLLVLLFAFFRLPEAPVENLKGSAQRKLRYWTVFTLVAFAIAVIRYVIGYHLSYLSNFIVVSISASLLSLVITSVLFKRFGNLSRTSAICFILAFTSSSNPGTVFPG